MKNPWLDIPLADYEAHMALPHVAQAALLSGLFGAALDRHAPRSVAMLGCAGGNGFERIAGRGIDRVVGVDINPAYLECVRARFGGCVPNLELVAGDVRTGVVDFAPVDLAFVGLLFEYVQPGPLLERLRSWLRPGGILVTVLQLPSATCAEVTPSPYTVLRSLAPIMGLVAPDRLAALADERGYRVVERRVAAVPGGKAFQVQTFALENPAAPADRRSPSTGELGSCRGENG